MRLIKPVLLTLALLWMSGCALIGGETTGDPTLNPQVDETQDMSAQELYASAQRFMRTGDYEAAITRLELLQGRHPFSRHATQAELDTIYAYYQLEEMASVIAAADRFLRANPRAPETAYVYYMRAMANLNRGQDLLGRLFGTDRSARDPEPLRQAFFDFRDLVERYPDSKYAEDARERMASIRSDLARHELHVARYYLKQKAYLAAAERAQAVVENYPASPAVDDALGILVRAYGALGLEDLRQDVLRVIRINHPDHPVLQEG